MFSSISASEAPMNDASTSTNDPHDASDVRALTISFVLGAIVGCMYGAFRYGLFSMQNLAMVGLGIITVVSLHAAWIGIRPSRA